MYQGRFINLDRSPDRRAAMEAQLRKWGLSDRYMRFAAIDGEDGQRACFRSHHAALEQADANSPVHVLEDDALLSGYVPQVIDIITSNEMLDHFDIVFTETLVAPDVMEIRELKQLFDKHRADETFMVRDITQTYYCGASSYLVGPKCRDRIGRLQARARWPATQRPVHPPGGESRQLEAWLRVSVCNDGPI
jgi:GR25 family glycosyltransferase involved in LPS biosynthesis